MRVGSFPGQLIRPTAKSILRLLPKMSNMRSIVQVLLLDTDQHVSVQLSADLFFKNRDADVFLAASPQSLAEISTPLPSPCDPRGVSFQMIRRHQRGENPEAVASVAERYRLPVALLELIVIEIARRSPTTASPRLTNGLVGRVLNGLVFNYRRLCVAV